MRVLLPLKKNKGAYQEDEEGILEEEERIAFSGSGVAVAAVAPCQEEAPSPPASPVARKPDSPVQFEPTKKRARTEYTFSAEADNEKPPAVSQNSESIMAGGRRAYGQDDEQEEVREDWSGAGSLRVVSRLETEPATPLENEAPVYNDANSNRSNVARLSSPVAAAAAAASHAETPQSTKPSNDTANVEINLTAFTQALKNRGLEMVPQEGDGNCLFRAVSLQVYGDSSNHADVRTQCLDFMARDPQHFGPFVTTDEAFSEYIARKRLDGVHGNHAEIQAASELFNRPVEVLGPTGQPLNIFHAEYKTADVPIRLSYHDGNHYNAVIDPLVPTAGLGLGFSDLKPGLADTMQVAKAVQESDQLEDEKELQRVMKASQEDELQRALKESTHSMDSVSCCHRWRWNRLGEKAMLYAGKQKLTMKPLVYSTSFTVVSKEDDGSLRPGCYQF